MSDVRRAWVEVTEYDATSYCFGLSEEKAQAVFERMQKHAHRACNGDFWETNGWLEFGAFGVSLDLEECILRISIPNEPEGDDRLDGMHEHWVRPHAAQWIEAIGPARLLLN